MRMSCIQRYLWLIVEGNVPQKYKVLIKLFFIKKLTNKLNKVPKYKESILKRISEEDPNWIADDDHLDRIDLTEDEAKKACEELKEKFGLKTDQLEEKKK